MLTPTPDLPDDTSLSGLLLTTRLVNALREAGFTTVGEVRESSDGTLLSLQDLGKVSVRYLRLTLGTSSASAKKL